MANDLSVSDIAAARVREVRSKRGMKVADLATRCTELGMPELTAQALYKLEQRRPGKLRPRPMTVDELLVLACALNVAPVHLLVPPHPPNEDELWPVAPGTKVSCRRARQFIRGYNPLPGMDAWHFYGQAPTSDRPSDEAIQGLVDSAGHESD